MNQGAERSQPIWASDRAFPLAPDGFGWVDPKGRQHPSPSPDDLLEAIGNDRDAKVILVWTPSRQHMLLPEEWPEAEEAVRKGREQRLKDDLATSDDRIRWFALILGCVLAYMFYQGWSRAPDTNSAAGPFVHALQVVIRSTSVGLCLLMFLILGFIPWYQARKQRKEWTTRNGVLPQDAISVLRFETWLEYQKAPATRLLMIMISLVGIAQILGGDSVAAAGLLKTPTYADQWWRVYTAPFLHGNVVHFLMNGAALLYLGKRMEVFARWPHVPLVFLLSAAVGNEASMRLLDAPAVGASGGLMGWLGFLLVFEVLHSKLVPRKAHRRLIAGVVLTAVIGLVGYRFIDNAAHAGGLVAGMLYALIVFPKSTSVFRPKTTKTDQFAGVLAFAVLSGAAAFAFLRILTAG